MGAVSSALAACLAADGTDAPTRTRQERAATVITAAYVRRHNKLLEGRRVGEALVGKSVSIVASADSAASVADFDGCTGMVTHYDCLHECCHVDIVATDSSVTLEHLEGRVAEVLASMQAHDTDSPEMQRRARQLLGDLTVPMRLLQAVIPRANVVVTGVVSLAESASVINACCWKRSPPC